MTDEEIDALLCGVNDGDETAVARLMGAHRPRIHRMVASRMDRNLRARIDPSDVVQEALLEASQRLPGYAKSQQIPFYPWLRQIAWDRLVDLHRRHVRTQKRSVLKEVHTVRVGDDSVDAFVNLIPCSACSPSAIAMQDELRRRIQSGLSLLDSVSREVLIMHYVEEMKLREIAVALSVSEPAIKSRHIRGLQKLAKLLGEDCNG